MTSNHLNQCWPNSLMRCICDTGGYGLIRLYRKTVKLRTMCHVPVITLSYPFFADVNTGMYPHSPSQYHARPKAKHGIAMQNVDKFPYPRKQTMGNEFIPCLNDVCDILKCFRSFNSTLSLLSVLNYRTHCYWVASYRQRKCMAINNVTSSMTFLSLLSLYASRSWRKMWDTSLYFTAVNQPEVRVSGEHGIIYITEKLLNK